MKRILDVTTIGSAVICSVFVILLPLSGSMELPGLSADGKNIVPNASVSVGPFRCAASERELWIFTGDAPYRGSIMNLEGMWDDVPATERRDWGWAFQRCGLEAVSFIDLLGQSAGRARYGDFPGVYYRHFEWRSSQNTWWTLCVSLWYPIGFAAMLPSWWLFRRLGGGRQFKLRSLLASVTLMTVALGIYAWSNS